MQRQQWVGIIQLPFRLVDSDHDCVFCAPLDRCIGQYIDQHSTDVSVDILTDAQPTDVGRYVDRQSTDILMEICLFSFAVLLFLTKLCEKDEGGKKTLGETTFVKRCTL